MKSMKNFIFILFFAFSVVSLTLSPVSASSLSSFIKIDLVNSSATLKKQKSLITEIKAGKIIGKIGGKALTTGVKAGLKTGFKTGVKSLKNSAKTIGQSAKKVGGSVKASVQKFNFFKPQTKTIPKTKTVPKKATNTKPTQKITKAQSKKQPTDTNKPKQNKLAKLPSQTKLKKFPRAKSASKKIPTNTKKTSFVTYKEFKKLPPKGTIDPKKIRFSQDSIKGDFRKPHGSLSNLTKGLKNGSIVPSKVKPIRIVNKDRKIYTLDNRRLKAFQDAEIKVPYKKLKKIPNKEKSKFTTKVNGVSIRIRK